MFMTIHRVSHETQGEYKCVASNFAGRTEKVYQVFVIGKMKNPGIIKSRGTWVLFRVKV